jgi:hypothetical protein
MDLTIGYHCFGAAGKKIADIGGGPVSMLLKSAGLGAGSVVVDPLGYPDWVLSRYAAKGIQYVQMRGEDWQEEGFDECNVTEQTYARTGKKDTDRRDEPARDSLLKVDCSDSLL